MANGNIIWKRRTPTYHSRSSSSMKFEIFEIAFWRAVLLLHIRLEKRFFNLLDKPFLQNMPFFKEI